MDEAARRLDRVRSLPLGGDVEFTREITQRVVEVALWRRATEGLLDTVACVLSRLTGTDQEPYCGELLVLGLRAAADLSHRGRARGDPAAVTRSLQGVDTLTAALDKMHGRPFANHPLLRRTAADKASWTAEWSRATGDNDPELWAAAAEQWETLQRPHRAAYAWWRCAEAFLYRTGYPSDAGKPLHSAAVASRGMAPLATEIRRMADRARITLARPATEEPPETTPAPLPALTRRELEVLRLVGAGRTNRQIGAELYMSPKTAAVHVTHILSKLGLANRAQAAAVAERAGLLDVEET
jgi:DNA-binding CsgD family transcriptional regulator